MAIADDVVRIIDSYGVVPWGKNKKGEKVTTNGVAETALGLTPFIRGWGPEGYFVANMGDAYNTIVTIAAIDWNRVESVRAQFCTPFNQGAKPWELFDKKLLLGPRNFTRVLQACYKSVPKRTFNAMTKEFWKARKERLKNYCVTIHEKKRMIQLNVEGVNKHEALYVAMSEWSCSNVCPTRLDKIVVKRF